MDSFFISHGSPMLAIDESDPARKFLQSWQAQGLSPRPTAILIISGHWDRAQATVNVVSHRNETIYDFYGFPKRMYQLKYPAPGAPELAKKVKELISRAGMGPVKEDKTRGLDHGAWIPLMLMYPEADIPVCQLSVQSEKGAAHHYNLGKALAPLRDQGVLIIGSGAATHNLTAFGPYRGRIAPWALEFDNWLKDSLLNGRHEEVNDYEKKAPHARMAHPWPDHFFPLHVALGAAGQTARAELIHHSWLGDSGSYASYRFTTAQ